MPAPHVKVLIRDLSTPFLLWLPADVLRKAAENSSSTWALSPKMEFQAFQLWLVQSPAYGINQSISLSYSAKLKSQTDRLSSNSKSLS